MAGMIKSIFGLTTEDVRKQQFEQQQDFAKQLQQGGYKPLEAQLGTALGTGLARALGFEGAGMAEARQVEESQAALNEQLAGLEQDDPRRLYLVGQALIEAGKPEEATRYFALARQFETGEEELALRREQMEDTEIGRAANLFGRLVDNPIYTPEQVDKIMRAYFPDVKLPELEDNINNIPTTTNPEADRIVEETFGG
jgi:hypothetical protein